jgi:hypothetical protein
VAFAVSGCAREPEQQRNVKTESPSSLDSVTRTGEQQAAMSRDSLRDDLVEHGLALPEGRAAVIALLGRPDSMSSHPEQNRHVPGVTDSIVQLFYPGLRLKYYVVSEGDREMLQTAFVTDNRFLRYPRLGVGSTLSDILTVLGKPGDRAPQKITYGCGRCLGGDSPVDFHLSGNRVTAVEYSFYVD